MCTASTARGIGHVLAGDTLGQGALDRGHYLRRAGCEHHPVHAGGIGLIQDDATGAWLASLNLGS